MSRLRGLDPARFLREYWQKRPLLIKGALPGFQDPLSAEELAGLACEDFVESRLVTGAKGKWQSRPGPFEEHDFLSLPEREYTLLVQNVDRWLPDVRELLDLVDFLPRWRVDDVLISYATPDGGVGPHFDWYDVFILQGQGSRRWRIGQRCDAATPLDTDSGLKILRHFEQQEDWLLEAGDLMYLPPGVAHWGEAVESGLSYSIGFRAPSLRELLYGLCDTVADELREDQRYSDPDQQPTDRRNRISPAALDRAQALLREALADRRALARWFGEDATSQRESARPEPPDDRPDEATLAAWLKQGEILYVNPVSRVAYAVLEGEILLFADGECHAFPHPSAAAELALLIGDTEPGQALELATAALQPQCLSLVAELYAAGSLIQAEEEDDEESWEE